MMYVDTDPDTQVRQFNRFPLQFILVNRQQRPHLGFHQLYRIQ